MPISQYHKCVECHAEALNLFRVFLSLSGQMMTNLRYCQGGCVAALVGGVVLLPSSKSFACGQWKGCTAAMHPASLCGKNHTEMLMSLSATPRTHSAALFPVQCHGQKLQLLTFQGLGSVHAACWVC